MKVLTFDTGTTVINALTQACNTAVRERKTVLAEINDIMIPVDKNARPFILMKEYTNKLNLKYEIEQIKAQIQK